MLSWKIRVGKLLKEKPKDRERGKKIWKREGAVKHRNYEG